MDIKEFDKITAEFLNTQKDECKEEYWCTQRSLAEEAMRLFRAFLFKETLAKKERYQQYLTLKEEFDKSDRDEE